jgi:hypothetical protein
MERAKTVYWEVELEDAPAGAQYLYGSMDIQPVRSRVPNPAVWGARAVPSRRSAIAWHDGNWRGLPLEKCVLTNST